MGILQRLGLSPAVWTAPQPQDLAFPILENLVWSVEDLSVEDLYRDQPHLRNVVGFIASTISSTSLHVYRRAADGGRERVRDGMLAALMTRANASMLMMDVLSSLVSDLCLYDEAIVVVKDAAGRAPELLPISPLWVQSRKWKDPWTLESLTIRDDKTGKPLVIPAEYVIRLHGYRPGSYKDGLSPVHALRDILREQIESAAYRGQLWRNGPRLGGVITRPQGATWDAVGRRRFKAAWQSQYSGKGSGAGGTPILEDGMKFEPAHLKADDEQVVEVTKLSLATVAGVYHVNPTMVGQLDNANYSNVREFRKSLYGDSLGPIIKKIEDTFNAFLLPLLHEASDIYVEFNLDEKLRASFEEKAAVTSQAVGAPWMTRNEARAMNNMPAIEGGDELIVPLNVGGQSNDPIGPKPTPDDGASVEDGGATMSNPVKSVNVDDMLKAANGTALLFRSGFDPGESAEAFGLPEIKHTGLLPVTLSKTPEDTIPELPGSVSEEES